MMARVVIHIVTLAGLLVLATPHASAGSQRNLRQAGSSPRFDYFLDTTTASQAAALACVKAAGSCSTTYATPAAATSSFVFGSCTSAAALAALSSCAVRASTRFIDLTGLTLQNEVPVATRSDEITGQGPANRKLHQASAAPIPSRFGPVRRWGFQYAPDAVKAPAAWDKGFDGTGVRVGVIDQGPHCSHPDLAPRLDLSSARSFVDGEPNVCNTLADFSHGSHVSGIIAGSGFSFLGVAPRATIVPLKVFPDAEGGGSVAAVLAALLYGSTIVDIINMSLGISGALRPADLRPDWGRVLHKVLNEVNNNGALVVVSAGNDALDATSLKNYKLVFADLPSTISVVASGPQGSWCPDPSRFPTGLKPSSCATVPSTLLPQGIEQPTTYTNYGTTMDITAPGGAFDVLPGECSLCGPGCGQDLGSCAFSSWVYTMIYSASFSTPATGAFNAWAAGTSMAAPAVSGAAALILQQNPQMRDKPAQIKAKLLQGAVPTIYQQGKPLYGKGFLNVAKSLGLE